MPNKHTELKSAKDAPSTFQWGLITAAPSRKPNYIRSHNKLASAADSLLRRLTQTKNNTRQQLHVVTEETPKLRRLEKGSPACDNIHKAKKNQKITFQNYSLISTANPES